MIHIVGIYIVQISLPTLPPLNWSPNPQMPFMCANP